MKQKNTQARKYKTINKYLLAYCISMLSSDFTEMC